MVPTNGQVVNYGDSNYMAVIYTPNPPLNGTGHGFSSVLWQPNYAARGNWFNPIPETLQWGKFFAVDAVDSVEHIYGIAFTADTIIHCEKGGTRRDKSIPIGLYLYNVPRGTSEPILIDSIIVDCTMPYKQFVYHAFDTYDFPHQYLHDTVPVFERRFSREHVFEPDDSVLITYGWLPTPPGLDCERYDKWLCFPQNIWPGDK